MTNLFLDIETAPNFGSAEEYFKVKNAVESGQLTQNSPEKDSFWKYKMGSLNPFDGKITLITFQINDGPVKHLKEWESNESDILNEFYQSLVDLNKYRSDQEHLRIIGHNILNFDIFFLHERLKTHFSSNAKWIYQWLIRKPEIIDFLQMHLPLNNLQTKGLRHNVLAYAYGFEQKITTGEDTISDYFNKQYDRIMEYSNQEFIYPQLYSKILNGGLISKERLSESINVVISSQAK